MELNFSVLRRENFELLGAKKIMFLATCSDNVHLIITMTIRKIDYFKYIKYIMDGY